MRPGARECLVEVHYITLRLVPDGEKWLIDTDLLAILVDRLGNKSLRKRGRIFPPLAALEPGRESASDQPDPASPQVRRPPPGHSPLAPGGFFGLAAKRRSLLTKDGGGSTGSPSRGQAVSDVAGHSAPATSETAHAHRTALTTWEHLHSRRGWRARPDTPRSD